MLNGHSLNSVSLNGAASLLGPGAAESILEDFELISSLNSIRLLEFIENIQVSDSLISNIIDAIGESISVSGVLTSSGVLNNILSSDIKLSDIINVIEKVQLSDNIDIVHTESLSSLFLKFLSESLNASDTIDNKLIAINSIALSFIISDVLLYNYPKLVIEDISLSSSNVEFIKAIEAVINSLTISLTSFDANILFIGIVKESVNILDTSSFTQILNTVVEDGIQLITIFEGDDVISGWVLNPETFAIWNYSNYNFNSMANLGSQTWLANSNGLFLMQGLLDENDYIVSRLKTPSFNFGTSNLKQVPDMYLGGSLNGELVLSVSTDERLKVKYKLKQPTTVSEIQTIKIGKGLRGALWQFELVDDSSTELQIQSLEWLPIVFGRKRR